VAVQTPHEPALDGTHPDDGTRADFEYGYLLQAVREVVPHMKPGAALVIVSTVLPGTTERLIRPLVPPWVTLVYSPSFIALGSAIADYRNPEVILCGSSSADRERAVGVLWEVFDGVVQGGPGHLIYACSIPSAELAKVAYNTFIGAKLAFANTVAQLADATGADADEVLGVVKRATDRLISPAYLSAGLGDGGACHPRDQLALSWLARRVGAYDLFSDLIAQREAHSAWIADVVAHWAKMSGLPVVLLGTAYKAGSTLDDGSPALLLLSQIATRLSAAAQDPLVFSDRTLPPSGTGRAVYVLGVAHEEYRELDPVPGSVVIDLWGIVPARPGVTLVRPGRRG